MESWEEKRAQVIARAWKDPEFKKRLLKNPKTALEEMGMTPTPNLKILVEEEAPKTIHLMLPQMPAHIEKLEDRELRQRAGSFLSAFDPTGCDCSLA